MKMNQKKSIFEKTLSKKAYLLMISFHLPIIFFIIFLSGYLSKGLFLILFFSLLRPVLLLFNNALGGIFNLPDFWIFQSKELYTHFVPWTPIIYFLIGLAWLQFRKKKEVTIKYLLTSMLFTWLILLALSFIFLRGQWGE